MSSTDIGVVLIFFSLLNVMYLILIFGLSGNQLVCLLSFIFYSIFEKECVCVYLELIWRTHVGKVSQLFYLSTHILIFLMVAQLSFIPQAVCVFHTPT